MSGAAGLHVCHLSLLVLSVSWTMKRKNRNPSASSTPPDGKKKKVAGNTEASTAATKAIDFSSPQRVLESLLSSTNLDNFFDEYWEKKPLFVSRENADFYGQMFTKKDLEAILKKEEIQFIEDMSLTRYAEGKTELLNEDGRVNMKHLKAAGVAVQFHQPDRYKVCNFIETRARVSRKLCHEMCGLFFLQSKNVNVDVQYSHHRELITNE